MKPWLGDRSPLDGWEDGVKILGRRWDPARLPADIRALGEDLLAEHRAMLAPASRAQIMSVLTTLFLALPSRDREGKELRAVQEIYVRALADIPNADLRAAADHLITTATFFPAPAEIRQAADLTMAPRRYAVSRLTRLLGVDLQPALPRS